MAWVEIGIFLAVVAFGGLTVEGALWFFLDMIGRARRDRGDGGEAIEFEFDVGVDEDV